MDPWFLFSLVQDLSETESRYAITELEMLAAVWAINKCRLYLVGIEFTVVVDHRPLLALLGSLSLRAKSLDCIDNPRLLRLRQKLLQYSFHVDWRQGKLHAIPDALSRAPVDQPSTDDMELEKELTSDLEVRVNVAITDLRHDDHMDNTRDLLLEELEAAARKDSRYSELAFMINRSALLI